MNKLEFYFKYIFRTENGRYNNWRFYFPLFGLALGISTVIITFSIMQGMEMEVFKKLELINFSSQIIYENFNKPNDGSFFNVINKKAIVSNRGEYRVVNIRAIEKFEEFKKTRFSDFLLESSDSLNSAILGSGLASKLNLNVGDVVELISPTDVSFLTGIPPSIKVIISGIFKFQLLNYDEQYIFTNLSIGENLFKTASKEIYSNVSSNQIRLKYKHVKNILTWRDKHIDFISAMNLEKLAFSSFGFLIILLSAFSSFSIMCVSVIRRIPEIGILRTLGHSKKTIAKIFFFQSLLISIIGSSIGILLSKLFIKLDSSYNLISNIFSSGILFDFNLNISNFQIFLISMIGFFIMLLAGIYPSIYASNISILKSLSYKR